MQNLIKVTVKALGLSKNPEANNDLKLLFSGINNIFQSIGTMRTHFGTAHGFSPGDYFPNKHYARLISDIAATSSSYLLYRLKEKIDIELTQRKY